MPLEPFDYGDDVDSARSNDQPLNDLDALFGASGGEQRRRARDPLTDLDTRVAI